MKRIFAALTLLAGLGLVAVAADPAPKPAPAWAFNASIIEACSCPMFCQCYFNTKPASHGGHEGHGGGTHFCKFNNVFRVNKGTYGDVKLDGLKFWVAGDLGGDLTSGTFDWAVLTFEPSATKAQRDAVATILGKVYPVKWTSFTVGEDGAIAWTATKDRAEAKLDSGKGGEVVLNRFAGNTADPVVIKNLKYWGVPRNDGFVLMPNDVEAWRRGDRAFEFKGTNGFMITIDLTSKDA